jgi:hypothetical protein
LTIIFYRAPNTKKYRKYFSENISLQNRQSLSV